MNQELLNEEQLIEYITNIVQSAFINKFPQFQLPIDIEIIVIDDKKSFGYVVLYLPQQPQQQGQGGQEEPNENVIRLGYIPFTTDYSYVNFLFMQLGDEIYPIDYKYLARYVPPEYLQNSKSSSDLGTAIKQIQASIKVAKAKSKGKIPEKVHKIIKSKKWREEAPKHFFLLPNEKKFPYKNPITGKVDCRLLRAAITRAAQHNYPKVESKARKLYQKHCSKEAADLIILHNLKESGDIGKYEKYLAYLQYKYANTNDEYLSALLELLDIFEKTADNTTLNKYSLIPIIYKYYNTIHIPKPNKKLNYELDTRSVLYGKKAALDDNTKLAVDLTSLVVLSGLGIAAGRLGWKMFEYYKKHKDLEEHSLTNKEFNIMDALHYGISTFFGGSFEQHYFGIDGNKLKTAASFLGEQKNAHLIAGRLFDSCSGKGSDKKKTADCVNKTLDEFNKSVQNVSKSLAEAKKQYEKAENFQDKVKAAGTYNIHLANFIHGNKGFLKTAGVDESEFFAKKGITEVKHEDGNWKYAFTFSKHTNKLEHNLFNVGTEEGRKAHEEWSKMHSMTQEEYAKYLEEQRKVQQQTQNQENQATQIQKKENQEPKEQKQVEEQLENQGLNKQEQQNQIKREQTPTGQTEHGHGGTSLKEHTPGSEVPGSSTPEKGITTEEEKRKDPKQVILEKLYDAIDNDEELKKYKELFNQEKDSKKKLEYAKKINERIEDIIREKWEKREEDRDFELASGKLNIDKEREIFQQILVERGVPKYITDDKGMVYLVGVDYWRDPFVGHLFNLTDQEMRQHFRKRAPDFGLSPEEIKEILNE